MLGSNTTTQVLLNEDLHDIIKIMKYFEESGLLIKSVSETVESKKAKRKVFSYASCYIGC